MNPVQLCVQVGETSKLLVNSYPPGGGERALPYGGRLAINPSASLRAGVQGVKGNKLLAESGDASSGWLWSGFSTKARKRRELEPAERLIAQKADGRPKRETSPFGHIVCGYVVSTRYEGRGVQCRPKVTENGHTERSNPSTALSGMRAGGQAGCPDGRDAPRSKCPG